MDSDIWDKYLASIYFVVQTLTTVGYGDMSVVTSTEKIFGIVLMILGVGFYSYTIGTLAAILSSVDLKEQKLLDKLLAFQAFASQIKLSDYLMLKTKRILERNNESIHIEEATFLEELPSSLRAEILTQAHNKLFNKITLFRNKDASFGLNVISSLRPLNIEAGDILYRQGDLVEEIYFILSGRVKLVTAEGYIFKIYVEGSYFGDTEILLGKTFRECNVIVDNKSNCELVSISKNDFLQILEDFPEYLEEFTRLAHERQFRNSQSAVYSKMSNFRIPLLKRKLLERGKLSLFNERYYTSARKKSNAFTAFSSQTLETYQKPNKKELHRLFSDNQIEKEQRNNLSPPFVRQNAAVGEDQNNKMNISSYKNSEKGDNIPNISFSKTKGKDWDDESPSNLLKRGEPDPLKEKPPFQRNQDLKDSLNQLRFQLEQILENMESGVR